MSVTQIWSEGSQMVDKKIWKNFTFCLNVFIAVFERQVNIRCSNGSISRPISRAIIMQQIRQLQSTGTKATLQNLVRCSKVWPNNLFSSYLQFSLVVRIFKVAPSLSMFLLSRSSMAQKTKQMKSNCEFS